MLFVYISCQAHKVACFSPLKAVRVEMARNLRQFFAPIWNLSLALYKSADARGATQLGAASLLLPVGSLVANIVFARTLGASGRGELAAVVAALAVCEVVISFGMPDILARHVARSSISQATVRSLAVAAASAALAPAIAIAVYCVARGFSWPVAVLAALIVPITAALALGKGVLNGRQDYRRLSVALLVNGIARFAAPIALLYADSSSESLALVLVLLASAAPAIPVLASRPFKGHGFDVRASIPILKESLRVWPTHLAWALMSKLDQLLLAALSSSADLGRYAVCAGIAEMPAILFNGARNVILARVARSHSFAGVFVGTALIVACGTAVGIVAAMFSAPLMTALFGSEFQSTALILGILLVAMSLDIAAGIATSCLIAVGRGGSVTVCYLGGLALTMTVLPLGLHFGGGALAAALTRLCAAALLYLAAVVLLRRGPTEVAIHDSE